VQARDRVLGGVIDCRLRGSITRVSLKSVQDNLGYYNDSISLYLAAVIR
jgi:hypothetical protein